MKSRQCCAVSLFVENHKVHTEESRSLTIYYIQSLILRSLEGQKYQGIYILEYPSTLCLIVRCIHWSIVATIHTSYDNMDKNAFPRTSETLGSVDNHHTEQDISIDFVSINKSIFKRERLTKLTGKANILYLAALLYKLHKLAHPLIDLRHAHSSPGA